MRTLTLIAVLLAPTFARGQLVVEPAVRDLGQIRGGQAVECSFQIKNTGPQAVELVDLERSCGCVEPRFSVRSLAPNGQATLSLRIRTLGQKEGPRTWPLTMVVRAGGETTKQPLEVRGVVVNEITMQPAQVALFVGKAVEQEIRLIDRRERPLRVTSWEAKMPGVRVEQVEGSDGTTRFKLSAAAEMLPKGRQDHVLHLYTDDPIYAHLEVPVAITRVEKPRVTWSPETPEVIVAAGEDKGSALIRVDSATAIAKVDTPDAGVTCGWQATDTGCFIRVAVLRETFRGTQTAVRVVVGTETIAIPVVVRIE